MTFRDKMLELLQAHGMFEQQARAVFAEFEKQTVAAEMAGRWREDVSGYPEGLVPLIWLTLRDYAYQWLEKNQPKAWFKPMFATAPAPGAAIAAVVAPKFPIGDLDEDIQRLIQTGVLTGDTGWQDGERWFDIPGLAHRVMTGTGWEDVSFDLVISQNPVETQADKPYEIQQDSEYQGSHILEQFATADEAVTWIEEKLHERACEGM